MRRISTAQTQSASFLFFFSLYAIFNSSPTTATRNPCISQDASCSSILLSAKQSDFYLQEVDEVLNEEIKYYLGDELTSSRRRLLGGPGSYPPRCYSKCGKCTPCRAVHVPVPPGTPVTAEYYPEAWRCKCGNRLYMP